MSFSLKDFSDIKKIAEGGMGKVYLATQVSLNRKVVIKELSSELLKEVKQIKRFENEAKSAAALEHDNIIRVYDFGEDKGSFFISMEYIDGFDLQQLMQWQPFPREIGLMILLEAIKGLRYAHQHGTIHCDVKPSNIFVSKAGRVKMVDFGLAHVGAQSSELIDSPTVFITPGYMPPEMANGNQKQDIRMDIWSAGVLAYRIICGKLPFAGDNVRSLVYSIVNEKEKDVRAYVPVLPDDLAEAVRLCLQKKPENRPTSLDPLIDSLQNYFFDIGIRDIEKEIRYYIADKLSAVAELGKWLLEYHIRKANELLELDMASQSAAHFKEAEKFGFQNNLSTKRITLPLPAGQGHTQKGRAVSGKKEILPWMPIQKSKKIKMAVSAVAILCIILIGAASAFIFAKRGNNPDVKFAPQTGNIRADSNKDLPKQAPQASVVASAEKEMATEYAALKQELTSIDRNKEVPEKPSSLKEAKTEISARTVSERPATARQAAGPKYGYLKLSVEPANAIVFMDGERTPASQFENGKRLKAGHHMIAVAAAGFSSFSTSLNIDANATQVLPVSLKQLQKGMGFLHVHSYPWADIYVDNVFQGTTPTPNPLSLSEGEHSLVLKRDGYQQYASTVHVDNGEVTRIKIQLEK
jgi:serine/threonine protein kinase